MNHIIELTSVSKSFNNLLVLQDINLEIKKGEIIGIIGRNGSGKSILLKMICGLVLPTTGTISVNGTNITKGNFPDNIGILLDNTGFLPNESGFDNLKHIAVIENKINDDEIKECIKMVGLNPNDKKPVKKYSLGMKQRLGIAMSIMEKPEILLLDEPTNGIDIETITEMRRLISELNKKQNTTVLIASHNRDDIDFLCTRVLKIENNHIIE